MKAFVYPYHQSFDSEKDIFYENHEIYENSSIITYNHNNGVISNTGGIENPTEDSVQKRTVCLSSISSDTE